MDLDSREIFYQFILDLKNDCLIVSHDQKLLRLCNYIYELFPDKLIGYQGSFNEYSIQKENQQRLISDKVQQLSSELKKQKVSTIKSLENQKRKNSQIKSVAIDHGLSKMARGILKRKSEKTFGKKKEKLSIKLKTIEQQIFDTDRQKIPNNRIKVEISQPNIHHHKRLLNVLSLNVELSPNNFIWNENINFEVYSDDRIWLKGKNGGGKSLLCKMISKRLIPDQGEVNLFTNKIAYLDQHTEFLNPMVTVYDQLKSFSSEATPEHEIRTKLGRFLFPKDQVFKSVNSLSFGEKKRLALACLLMKENPPELLILDEPDNHLDLPSLTTISTALADFHGSIILISHDEVFVEQVRINREIVLENFINKKPRHVGVF